MSITQIRELLISCKVDASHLTDAELTEQLEVLDECRKAVTESLTDALLAVTPEFARILQATGYGLIALATTLSKEISDVETPGETESNH